MAHHQAKIDLLPSLAQARKGIEGGWFHFNKAE
jgi:hypothetical protein